MKEIIRILGFVFVIGSFVIGYQMMGGWALAIVAVNGIGWMIVYMMGLPKFLLFDLNKALPPDTREKLYE